jgi:hypothetical protein
MVRVKGKQGKEGKKVDTGKVSKSSHQYGEPMVGGRADIKVKKIRVKVKKECEREGCKNPARSKGRCVKHGGGKRCSEPDCDKAAEKRGKCSRHGRYSSEAHLMNSIALAVWRSVTSGLRWVRCAPRT